MWGTVQLDRTSGVYSRNVCIKTGVYSSVKSMSQYGQTHAEENLPHPKGNTFGQLKASPSSLPVLTSSPSTIVGV